MRRALALAATLAGLLCAPAAVQAQSAADTAAQALQNDPVYVHPGAADRLTTGERGRIRLAIVDDAIGRMKVAVVPGSVASGADGAAGFAQEIDETLDAPGSLIVVAGSAFHVITSHPESDAAAAALRTAVTRNSDKGLAAQLLAAVPRIAAADPGASADLGGPDSGSSPGASPVGDPADFFGDIEDAFKTGILLVAGAIALPFILGAGYLLYRVRRTHAREAEASELGERSTRDALVALGEGIRSLDLDTSMPNANRAGMEAYEHALASYDQANGLLIGDPSPHRVQQAWAAIEAGQRHLQTARERLG